MPPTADISLDTLRPAPLPSLLAQGSHRFRGVYAHVPFCRHKCHYCDFYSFVDAEDRRSAYVERAKAEIDAWAGVVREPLETLFVGGGTPTMLRARELSAFLAHLRQRLPWSPGAEWTVEANPETVDADIAAALADAGVNRVSMGAQSFQPRLLQALERHHDPASVGRAVERLRSAGMAQVNLDLIYAVPGGTLAEWQDDLRQALALGPDHVSCYGLMYESNTPLGQRHARGQVQGAPEDLELAMHQAACDALAAAGLEHYEISNWARPGMRCRHNELYWRNEDWLAIGPAASGHASGLRWRNVPRLGDWLAQGPWSPVQDVERLDDDGQVGEAFMMGLRLLEGMPVERVQALLRRGQRGVARELALAAHMETGLLEASDGRIRHTPRGRMLASQVAMDLL
jgi:oxygen-independent coproporphyrinogen-3 oxidase